MTRDIAARRHSAILAKLDETGSVTVEELAQVLDVSRETVRRDLKALSAGSLLAIVHGGAIRNERSEASFANRRTVNRAGKEVIAGRDATSTVRRACFIGMPYCRNSASIRVEPASA